MKKLNLPSRWFTKGPSTEILQVGLPSYLSKYKTKKFVYLLEFLKYICTLK